MKEEFLARMKAMLQDEYPTFLAMLDQPRFRGVRYNSLKITKEQFQRLFPYAEKPTPFCPTAFYLDHDVQQIGNHPLHMSGAMYLQEPSACSAVEILDVKEGDWVLDLCAAPGGKSTQIAEKLAHWGLLIANEIDAQRAQVLMSNLERTGFGEVVITQSHPKMLCEMCRGWFDKVLVDAPCSGEGMMKKHDEAALGWSVDNIHACAKRQLEILVSAADTLKDQGFLVYSTCTYAQEENEAVVQQLLALRNDLVQVDCGVSFGRCGIPYPGMDANKVRRIFPMDQGEGHFIAKFQKIGMSGSNRIIEKPTQTLPKFCRESLETILAMPAGNYDIQRDKVYYRRTAFLDLKKVRVLRQGICCGTIKKQRLEPHHHLFMSSYLRPYLRQIYEMNDTEWHRYQAGEELVVSGYFGYTAMAWQSLVVGFAKGDHMVLKNKYPKGLRRK